MAQVRPTTSIPVPDQPTERLKSGPAHSWRKATVVVAALTALAVAFLLVSNGSEGPNDKSSDTADGRVGATASDRTETETSTAVPTPSGNDAALASSLNEEGFAMIEAGDYEGAVPVLEEAIKTFPPGTDDLNYAYALFNLGNALRLSGRPEEAIPVLEQRLGIPNQTDTVRSELAAARSEAN